MPNIIGEAFIAIRPETAGFGVATESKLKSIFSGGSGVLAGTAVLAVGVGAALLDIGTKFQSSYNAIARGTGATGDQLNKLKGDFKTVLGSTAGSFEQVQAAIIGVSRATGLTGPPLDAMAKQFVTLARITKTDVAANIAATEPLFAKFNVAAKDQGAALDVLFKASQFSGLSVAELADKMKSGGTVLKNFGYTFSQSAALIAEFTKAGVNSDQAISALKKGFASFAKAGEDPQKAMNALVASIKSAPSEAAATGLALKAFGAKAGPELVAAIRSGKLNIDELMTSIASGKNGILATANATPTLAGAFAKLKNQVLVALEPIATKLLTLVTIAVGKIIPAFQQVIGVIGPIFKTLGDLWSAFMDGFKTGDSASSLGLTGFIGTLVDLGVQAKRIFDFIMAAWDAFMGGFQNPRAMNAVAGFTGTMIKFGQIVRPIFDWMKDHVPLVLMGAAVVITGFLVPAFIAWASAAAASAVATLAAAAPFIAIGLAIAALVVGVIYAYNHFKIFREAVQAVASFFVDTAVPAFLSFIGFIQKALQPLVEAFVSRWGEIKQIVMTVLGAVGAIIAVNIAFIEGIWSVFHATIFRILVSVWNEIKLVVTTVINIVADIIKLVLDVLTGHWSKAWNDLLDILRNVFGLVIGTIENALSIVGNVLASLGGIVLRELGKLPDLIIGALAGIGNWLFNAGNDLIRGLINGILSTLGGLGGLLKHGIGSAIRALPGGGIVANVLGFALGGVVPGPIGRPQLAVVHGGEEVLTPDQQRQRAKDYPPGGGPMVSVTQNIYPQPGQSEVMIGAAASARIAWDLKPLGTGGRSG